MFGICSHLSSQPVIADGEIMLKELNPSRVFFLFFSFLLFFPFFFCYFVLLCCHNLKALFGKGCQSPSPSRRDSVIDSRVRVSLKC